MYVSTPMSGKKMTSGISESMTSESIFVLLVASETGGVDGAVRSALGGLSYPVETATDDTAAVARLNAAPGDPGRSTHAQGEASAHGYPGPFQASEGMRTS